MKRKQLLVLGIHPSSRGFGWALFDGPLSPFDWGCSGGDSARALVRMETIFTKYEPHVLVIEEFEGEHVRRALRIRELYRMVVRSGELRSIAIRRFTRMEVSEALASARTRQAVAEAVAEQVKPLRPRLPKPRRIWEGERPAMPLFCAAACILTYYAVQERASAT